MAVPAISPNSSLSDLPSSSSPDLILVPVTTKEHENTWTWNAEEWKGPLSLEQYFERERFLNNQDLSKDGRLSGWILTSTTLPLDSDGTRPILASCETLLKSAYVARDGKIDKVLAHGIGSVFTPSIYRGRGYASRMMKELGKRLETYQQLNGDKGSFSVLFSDIGQQFYARHGWKAFESTHIHLASTTVSQYDAVRTKFPAVDDLSTEEVSKLPAVSWLEESLRVVSEQSPSVPCVAIRPDVEHFRWHHAREEIQTRILNLPFPRVKGALHKPTGITLVWCRVFAKKHSEWSLHVLQVIIPPALRAKPTDEARDALSALLLRAQYEAHIWNMQDGVEVWDPSEFVVSAAQNLRTEEQDKVEVIRRDKEHICSLKWIGARAEDDASQGVKWFSIEKYSWC